MLAAFAKDAPGTEAALKYCLMGALLGVTMLAGTALLHGAGHATLYRERQASLQAAPYGLVAVGLVAVLTGLLFKAGEVPAHFWAVATAYTAGTVSLALGLAGGTVLPFGTGNLLP